MTTLQSIVDTTGFIAFSLMAIVVLRYQRRVNDTQIQLNASMMARLAALEKELVDVVRREYAARGKPQ